MNIAEIKIHGLIGNIPGEFMGVTLLDVISQIENAKATFDFPIDVLNVSINSEGGVVEDGNQIYDYLHQLKSEMTVNTKSAGAVSSIASKIFLVGQTRIMRKHDRMLLHNPWSNPTGNASTLENAADELRSIEKEMIKFYAIQTGLNESAIKSIMENETVLDGQKAKELGFATEVIEAPMAFAYHIRQEQPTQIENNEKNFLTQLFSMKNLNVKNAIAFLQSLVKDESKPVLLDLTMADGTMLRSSAETPDEIVGSTMTVVTTEGETPLAAGTYELNDGTGIVVNDASIVIEVVAAVEPPEEPTELQTVQAKLDALQIEKDELDEKNVEMKEKLKVVNSKEFKDNVLAMAQGLEDIQKDKDELKRVKTAFNLPLNQAFIENIEVVKTDISVEAKKRKEEYKKRGISMN